MSNKTKKKSIPKQNKKKLALIIKNTILVVMVC